MKAKLLPLYFKERNPRETREFEEQLKKPQILYGAEADFLPPSAAGRACPSRCRRHSIPPASRSCLSIPRIYRERLAADYYSNLRIRHCGNVGLGDRGLSAGRTGSKRILPPYQCELAKVVLRALSAKRKLRSGMKFLMLQDNPGEGMQAYLFKRFYWWDKSCTRQIEDTFWRSNCVPQLERGEFQGSSIF